MSRRARLWSLALFLGLAVIPMVYLTLTWNPQDPLRFRLTRVPGQTHGGVPLYEVEVVNTRSVPIRLHDGILWMDQGNASSKTTSSGALVPGDTAFLAQFDMAATLHGWSSTPGATRRIRVAVVRSYSLYPTQTITIPSHGTRAIRIRVLEGTGLLPQNGQLRIRYIWISQSRHLTDRAISWLRRHAPALSPHLPHLKPEDTCTTIEFHKEDLDPMHEPAEPAGQRRVTSASTRQCLSTQIEPYLSLSRIAPRAFLHPLHE